VYHFSKSVSTRNATKSTELKASEKLVLVGGDIGQAATAQKVAEAAIQRLGSIDAVANHAGIFSAKPFTDFAADDFRALVSTNLEGYMYFTQLAVKHMLAQESGGSENRIRRLWREKMTKVIWTNDREKQFSSFGFPVSGF
jgi:NAD(P)-dependent dehydrogenase (short-subunit alcohol dehydrogenase family)